jgi:PAS domain S-box-containing protein
MEHLFLNSSLSQNLLRNLPGMLYHCKNDIKRTITHSSNGCYDLTGYYSEELLDGAFKSYIDLIHPEDVALVRDHFKKHIAKQQECNCEYRIIHRDGGVIWVKDIANGIYSDTGDLLYIEGYISDITDKKERSALKKQLEANLSTGEIYKATLNISPDIYLRITKSGDCFSFNKIEDNELETEPFSKSALKDLFPAIVAENFFANTKNAIATGNSYTYEYQQTGTDRTILDYEARFLKRDDNEVLCIIRDITSSVKARKEAEVAKEFYESIIDNVNIDIAIYDENNCYRLLSKSAVKDPKMREWLIGKDDFAYCRERNKSVEIAESRTEMYNLVDELKKPIEWIEELADDSGKKKYFVRTLKPLKGPGNKKYKVGYGVDITALKIVQNELLRREHLLSFSHKLAKVGYWVWYPNNRKHEWSDGVFEILEEDKRSNIAPSLTSYLDFIHIDDRDRFKKTIDLSKQNNSSYSIEYRIVTRAGKIKHIKEQSSSKRSDSNSNQYLFGMVQDITEMQISQDALAHSEEHFRAIAESSPIYILELRDDYKIMYVNNSGQNSKDLIGKSALDLVLTQYYSTLKETFARVFNLGIVENLELQGNLSGDSIEWYDVSIGPVKNDSGKVTSLILLAQNITDKKQNEQERERLIKEINNRYNELMQFNYIVSHNLRSPIANILGMSYILNPTTPPEDVKQIFDYIMQSAESIDTLIKDLNDVLTARSPLNEKREEFLLTEIIQGVCHNLEQQINHSNALINVDISDDANELTSIKSYVQSIIYNLVSNAIKYKSEKRNPDLSIKAWKETNHTHIEVSDNGMGIDLDQYGSQMFGLYKRFTTQNEGKGLGLHMTKAQVESLGGSISVESELGKGTTFKIVFTN